jgi:hypothetical protein
MSSDTSQTLDIQANDVTKMTIGSTIDIQGNELVLDADADTSIHASTDDQIDFKVAGADCMKINSSGNLVMAAGKNLCIGDDDDVVIGRATDNRMTFNTNSTERGRIDENGIIMLGSTSSDLGERLHVAHTGGGAVCVMRTVNSGGTVQIGFKNANGFVGEIVTSGSGTSYATSSDYRLKENVNYTFDATSRLKQLKPARFNFKADADTTLDGFLAHEVSSIVPEAVTGEKDATKLQNVYDEDNNKTGTETVPDYQGIDQSKLVPLLVKTIQELEARITALES